MTPAVFVDRDNTLIENDGDLGDPEQVRLIRGAASAIASLKGLGYRVIVVTNQGGVARGKYGEPDVEAVHQKINDLVRANAGITIDRFYYCPYHPKGTVAKYAQEHPWRKPQPGMMLQAAKDLELDLSQSWTIGDQMRDVEAGAAAGTRTILLDPGAEEAPPLATAPRRADDQAPHFRARNLVEAVRIVAQQRKPEPEATATTSTSAGQPPKWDAQKVKALREANQQSSANGGTPAKPAPREPKPFRPMNAPPLPAEPAPAPPAPQAATATLPAPEVFVPTPPPPPPVTAAPPPTPLELAANANTPATLAPDALDPADERRQRDTLDAAEISETLLRQILQELRNQREIAGDVSVVTIVALMLQLIALVCLAAGLWLGTQPLDLLRWLAVALIAQLATIAMLLFKR
jgi:D-glycero-D-manno-heptose 1,7-bisphosphate phosphatase